MPDDNDTYAYEIACWLQMRKKIINSGVDMADASLIAAILLLGVRIEDNLQQIYKEMPG